MEIGQRVLTNQHLTLKILIHKKLFYSEDLHLKTYFCKIYFYVELFISCSLWTFIKKVILHKA